MELVNGLFLSERVVSHGKRRNNLLYPLPDAWGSFKSFLYDYQIRLFQSRFFK